SPKACFSRSPSTLPPSFKTVTSVGKTEKRGLQRRVRDVCAHTDKYYYYVYVDGTEVKQQYQNDTTSASRPPKPVDEDFYKIPPELIYSSRRPGIIFKEIGLYTKTFITT
ncbi:hypothetical protein HID58_014364, partial [Brassica napus]